MITSGAVPQEVELSLLDTLTHPPVQRPHLRNWSRTFGCRPELLFYPANVEEVRTIVKEAVRQNRRVRAFGEGNSPSSSWCSNEWSVSLKLIRHHFIDPTTKLATFGAGLTNAEVLPLLERHGLTFPSIGSISEVSIGACFSSSEHGTGTTAQVMATRVAACVIVVTSGEVIQAKRNGKNHELWATAASGLGLGGIVVEVTMECIKVYNVEVRMDKLRLADILHDGSGGLLDVASSAEQVKIWWFPNAVTSTDCILWRTMRTTAPVPTESAFTRAATPIITYLTHVTHALAFLFVIYVAPALQPLLNTLLYVLRSTGLPKTMPPTSSWKAQLMDCLYYQLVDEWAVPFAPESGKVASGPSAVKALSEIHDYLSSPAGRATRLHAPFEIRFGASDALPLSPLHSDAPPGTQKFIWLEPIVYRPLNLPSPNRLRSFFDVFERIASTNGGRPHATKAHIPGVYPLGEEGEQRRLAWKKVRDVWDPEGLWWNDWLREHVGIESDAGAQARRVGLDEVMGEDYL